MTTDDTSVTKHCASNNADPILGKITALQTGSSNNCFQNDVIVMQNSFATDLIHIKRKVLGSNIVLDVQYSYCEPLVKY